MADYTQLTLFTPKDSLPSGNAAKKIRGAEFDPEFAAISTAVASKLDSDDLASNSEAAALAANNKLIAPSTLAYALQNATIVLGANVQLNGGIAATDVARLSQANVFTANQAVSGTQPQVRLFETDAGTNVKNWLLQAASGVLTLGIATDAAPTTVAASAITVTGSAGTISSVNLAGTAVTANGSTIWHATNDGSGSGLDADLLDGLNAVSGAATANTIAARNANGDIFARYLQSSATDSENPTVAQFMITNGADNVVRKASAAHVRTALAVPKMAWGFIAGVDASVSTSTSNYGVSNGSKGGTGIYLIPLGTWSGGVPPSIQVTPSFTGQISRRCSAESADLGGGVMQANVRCYDIDTPGVLLDTNFHLLAVGVS